MNQFFNLLGGHLTRIMEKAPRLESNILKLMESWADEYNEVDGQPGR